MEWNFYPENKPEMSGRYVISISKPYANNDITLDYVGYYDIEKDSWFKYDPFQNDGQDILEELPHEVKINGWLKGLRSLFK